MQLSRLVALISLVSTAVGQDARPIAGRDVLKRGTPAEVGIDKAKLATAVAIVRSAVAKDLLRGAVVLVARKRKIVLHEAFGFRDAEKKLPMRGDSLFRMASNSKAVTATAALILADEAKLKIDDPVHRFFPTFGQGHANAITIRHLLTHTSGLGKALFLRPLLDETTLQKEVARFGERGIGAPPGKAYNYSNTGYNTLAGVIDVLSESGYKEFLRERIYEPLGMRDSCNHESDADHDRMSAVFRRRGDGQLRPGWQPGDRPDFPIPRGSGGMISTARDYAVFCQMFLNGGSYGGRRILSRERAKSAILPQAKFVPAAKRYGFGWVTTPYTFSHTGSDGTASWANVKRELIVLVFTQSPGKKGVARRFYEAVLGACKGR